MNNKDRQVQLGQPKIECIIYKKNKRAFIKRAREIVEAQVGYTGDAFWNALMGEFRTTYAPIADRKDYIVQARLAYHSDNLWILEGATTRKKDNHIFYWTIEVHKPTRYQEDLMVWTFGQDSIDGGI